MPCDGARQPGGSGASRRAPSDAARPGLAEEVCRRDIARLVWSFLRASVIINASSAAFAQPSLPHYVLPLKLPGVNFLILWGEGLVSWVKYNASTLSLNIFLNIFLITPPRTSNLNTFVVTVARAALPPAIVKQGTHERAERDK